MGGGGRGTPDAGPVSNALTGRAAADAVARRGAQKIGPGTARNRIDLRDLDLAVIGTAAQARLAAAAAKGSLRRTPTATVGPMARSPLRASACPAFALVPARRK